METLQKQGADQQQHITVLREQITAKEQHASMLQSDVCNTYSRYLPTHHSYRYEILVYLKYTCIQAGGSRMTKLGARACLYWLNFAGIALLLPGGRSNLFNPHVET